MKLYVYSLEFRKIQDEFNTSFNFIEKTCDIIQETELFWFTNDEVGAIPKIPTDIIHRPDWILVQQGFREKPSALEEQCIKNRMYSTFINIFQNFYDLVYKNTLFGRALQLDLTNMKTACTMESMQYLLQENKLYEETEKHINTLESLGVYSLGVEDYKHKLEQRKLFVKLVSKDLVLSLSREKAPFVLKILSHSIAVYSENNLILSLDFSSIADVQTFYIYLNSLIEWGYLSALTKVDVNSQYSILSFVFKEINQSTLAGLLSCIKNLKRALQVLQITL